VSGRHGDRFLSFPGAPAAAELAAPGGDAAAPPPVIPKPDELTWWDWAVFLLHAAAEIEHALLVQYLYAAYSLDTAGGSGTAIPGGAAVTIGGWRNKIVTIAKEEMGHLLTEQNLLRFIGGPLTFERGDFPLHSALYPFPLSLRPLTKTSLATYIAAEMPASPVPEIGDIIARATNAEGGVPVNRVGVLFDTLIGIFSDETRLTDADLRGQTAPNQADAASWLASGHLIVRTIANRADAVSALQAIADQGEGSANPPAGAPLSHFDRFLAIYHDFPETESAAEPPWNPTSSIPDNPSTAATPDPHPAVERGRITDPVTRLWAQLFNVRYRMLLIDLEHSLLLPGLFADGSGNPTLRGQLCADAFQQMRGDAFSGLKGIAGKLTTRPLKQTAGPDDPKHAGPPFELPYTLALADGEYGRWRMHLALLDTTRDLVTSLRGAAETGPLLDELDSIDAAWRAVVEVQLAATETEAL
jgi:ferritin-like protein